MKRPSRPVQRRAGWLRGGLFWQNAKTLDLWRDALDAGPLPVVRGYRPSVEDRLREEVIARVLCDGGVDLAQLSGRLGVDVADHFGDELDGLDDLVTDGLLTVRGTRLQATATGRFFLRNIAVRFDAYASAASGAGRYSRAV